MIPDKKPAEGEADFKEYTVADLVRAQRGEIFFIQLPDHLPVVQPTAAGKPAVSDQPAARPAPPDNISLSRLQVGVLSFISTVYKFVCLCYMFWSSEARAGWSEGGGRPPDGSPPTRVHAPKNPKPRKAD